MSTCRLPPFLLRDLFSFSFSSAWGKGRDRETERGFLSLDSFSLCQFLGLGRRYGEIISCFSWRTHFRLDLSLSLFQLPNRIAHFLTFGAQVMMGFSSRLAPRSKPSPCHHESCLGVAIAHQLSFSYPDSTTTPPACSISRSSSPLSYR